MERAPGSLSRKWPLVIATVTALAVAGCAFGADSYRPSAASRVVPDGNTVTITHAGSAAEARPLADGYCSKFDRVAHFEHMGLFRPAHARFSSSSAVFMCDTAI